MQTFSKGIFWSFAVKVKDEIPDSKMFSADTAWDVTRPEHSSFLCIVKSRRLRWAEHATRIWDKISAGKTSGRPRMCWESKVEVQLKESDVRTTRARKVTRCCDVRVLY